MGIQTKQIEAHWNYLLWGMGGNGGRATVTIWYNEEYVKKTRLKKT